MFATVHNSEKDCVAKILNNVLFASLHKSEKCAGTQIVSFS